MLCSFLYCLINPKPKNLIPEFSENDNSILIPSDINGVDDRIRITPTTDYPWSSIVKIFVTWDGYSTYGSDTMIDKIMY